MADRASDAQCRGVAVLTRLVREAGVCARVRRSHFGRGSVSLRQRKRAAERESGWEQAGRVGARLYQGAAPAPGHTLLSRPASPSRLTHLAGMRRVEGQEMSRTGHGLWDGEGVMRRVSVLV
eukprot:3242005-Rhodomonas_salina.2